LYAKHVNKITILFYIITSNMAQQKGVTTNCATAGRALQLLRRRNVLSNNNVPANIIPICRYSVN